MNKKSYFSKVWNAISGTFFKDIEYASDNRTLNSGIHDYYDITDPTEIKLISSRRTFL